jgi:hypothetical protein
MTIFVYMLARIFSSGIWVEIYILLNNRPNLLFVLGFTEPGYDKNIYCTFVIVYKSSIIHDSSARIIINQINNTHEHD